MGLPFGLVGPPVRGQDTCDKAPPSTETVLSALTRDQLFGRIVVAKQTIFPGSPVMHEARPKGGLSCFWVSVLPTQAAQITCAALAMVRGCSGMSNKGLCGSKRESIARALGVYIVRYT
jgi:hypothetical protein